MNDKRYRFEIERMLDGPRPWEWRIWRGDELCVTGSKATAQLALIEAMITAGIDDDKWQAAPPPHAGLNILNRANTSGSVAGDGIALYSCAHPICEDQCKQ